MRPTPRRDYTDQEIYELSKLSPRRRAVQSLARAAIVVATRAVEQNRQPIGNYVREGWGRDETFNSLIRASVAPASTTQAGWAAELGHVAQAFLETLKPMSAGADLLRQCLRLSFDRAAKLVLPSIAPGVATFIPQGALIPVPKLTTWAAANLTPCKLAAIIEVTREMLESSNAESIITQALIDSAAPGLDAVLFSNNAAVADTSPAGLLNGVTPITASTSTIQSEAMGDDLAALVGNVAARAGNGNICFVAAPEQATRILLEAENVPWPILMTTALAKGTVICVALNALVSVIEPPVVDAARAVTIREDDTAPSSDPTTGPRRSLWQTDTVALRLKMPVTWAVRDPTAISVVNSTKW